MSEVDRGRGDGPSGEATTGGTTGADRQRRLRAEVVRRLGGRLRSSQPAGGDVGAPESRWARAGAAAARGMLALLTPDGLPVEASQELEAAFGDIGREALVPGPGRIRRLRAQVAAAPPRLLDRISTHVVDHPAVCYDVAGVEALALRQSRSIGKAVGMLQLALVGAASASTLEGGAVLAIAIDGVVGQVAAAVHGICDWYTTGSYVVRRLQVLGLTADVGEIRRLTNAALMSRGAAVDTRLLASSTELRLIRRWAGQGLVDALPFGSSLGKTSVRAAKRIDATDMARLLAQLRTTPDPT